MKQNHPAIILLLFLLLLASACGNCDSTYNYQIPKSARDGIACGSAESVGINEEKISECIEKIYCGEFGEIHSLLIYRNDRLVLEEYFPGYLYKWDAPDYRGEPILWNGQMLHPIMSCNKSYASAAIGIAIDKGFIKSENEPIFNYLPDHQQFKKDGKENITIEHLLSMSSGLDWNEWNAPHGTSANDIDRVYFECGNDPLSCVLGRQLIHRPGEVFNYNGGGTIILGEIVKNASGYPVDKFLDTFLFKTQGIDSTIWYRHPNGVIAMDGSLYLRSRDMLKFGILYLNEGKWQDQQLISKNWIDKSITEYGNNRKIKIPIEDSGKNSYGYQWWISRLDHNGEDILMYRANGWGGQVIMVFPERDMVVVITSGNFASKSRLFKLVNQYILPALS